MLLGQRQKPLARLHANEGHVVLFYGNIISGKQQCA